MSNLDPLYVAVQSRPRPEDVAELILSLTPDGIARDDRMVLEKAARHSLRNSIHAYSSMAADFKRPTGADRQVKVASILFKVEPLSAIDCLNPKTVSTFLAGVTGQILRGVGHMNFKEDRLNREDRLKAGVVKGHRAYNKRFRVLVRLEEKIQRMIRNDMKLGFTQMAKSSHATRLSREELLTDSCTASFVAYMTARMNLRSQFTNGSQTRAFDTIAEMLYRRATEIRSPNWWAIAHVHPEAVVLNNLTDEQRGRLMALWFNDLKEIGDFLGTLAKENSLNLRTMVVGKGMDSTTWNATAGAWNKTRAGWVELLYAMGADAFLAVFCPGKVMRVMAGDVVRWHGKLHPGTQVWADLPKPWMVMQGEISCTRKMIEDACSTYRVDPKGWILPRSPKKAVQFRLTPELVHGVTVGSAYLASVLRKAGVFSGK